MRTTTAPAADSGPAFERGRRFWLQGTLAAALTVTALEAALLQQKKAFFTGGFLAATHASGATEAAGFLAISLLVDISLAGAIALAVLWLTARLELTRTARLFLVTSGAAAPLLIWDFINYSLFAYLGDAFDFGLMFDLSGRNPEEILAVASSHAAAPALLTLGATAGLGAGVWALNRFGIRGTRTRIRVSRRLAAAAAALVGIGILATAAASRASETIEDGLRRKPSGNLYTRITSALTDFDRDGFGIGGRTSDPAPFDGAIYPYAIDVPGNGIDEDGVGGDLPPAAPYQETPAATAEWRRRPDVILFVLESFRADAVGRLVNGQTVTPVLDGLAREGVSSARAFSHNGYTIQSRFHLFTGSLAGVRPAGSIVDDFKAQGYETAYFSGQNESFGGAAFGVGFDRADVAYDARQDRGRRYTTFATAGSLAVSHLTLQERIDAFLAGRDRSRPLFLYVNFHDTHYPYHHRDIEPLVSRVTVGQAAIAPARRDDLHEMYLNTAANVDRAIGRTLAAVERAAGSPPAVVVTGDHGESLFDEGFLGHGYALNDVQTRIPLIVRGLPMEIGEPFGQVDLRDAIGAALARDPANGSQPRVVAAPGKIVFQYLGGIHRPRQIALTGAEGRTIYDFRDNRVTLPDGTTVRPEALAGPAAGPFLRLVHLWERMMASSGPGAVQAEGPDSDVK